MPTIHDVAREAGVSARTVSRAINDAANVAPDTRRRVLEAAERLSFRPDPSARALKSGRKRMVGVVANAVSSDATLRRIEVVSKLFNASGYAMLLQYADSFEVEESAVKEAYPRCDGLVVFTNLRSERSTIFDSLAEEGYPFVLVDPPGAVSYPSVRVDRRSGYREAVKYLNAKGRRRFLLLVEDFRSAERIEGFREGLAAAGLSFAEGFVAHTVKGFEGGFRAAEDAAELRRSGELDAVLCHNDKIALGLIAGLRARGIEVPSDVAVVGFDDDAYGAYAAPPLTTIAQGGGDVGAYIFEQLRNRIEYGTPVQGKTFGTGLVTRASA